MTPSRARRCGTSRLWVSSSLVTLLLRANRSSTCLNKTRTKTRGGAPRAVRAKYARSPQPPRRLARGESHRPSPEPRQDPLNGAHGDDCGRTKNPNGCPCNPACLQGWNDRLANDLDHCLISHELREVFPVDRGEFTRHGRLRQVLPGKAVLLSLFDFIPFLSFLRATLTPLSDILIVLLLDTRHLGLVWNLRLAQIISREPEADRKRKNPKHKAQPICSTPGMPIRRADIAHARDSARARREGETGSPSRAAHYGLPPFAEMLALASHLGRPSPSPEMPCV